ncbi:hypothetical protein CHUAL_010502 [Chamberlinius hualienensis]
MPKYGTYLCSAIDQFDDDKYIFYWASSNYLTKPMFTIVKKDDINGTKLQEGAVPDVFNNFEGNIVSSVFTINNVTFIRGADSWVKYEIEKSNDGLISKAVKLIGGISNPLLQDNVYASTAVGNDSVLWRMLDSKSFCFHISLIDNNQIDYPQPRYIGNK